MKFKDLINDNVSIKDLRGILFEVDNQDMTFKELKDVLENMKDFEFNIHDLKNVRFMKKMRVKSEIYLVFAGDVAGVNEDITLHEGEEYYVQIEHTCNGWPVVYVNGMEYDMTFQSEEELLEFWEEV